VEVPPDPIQQFDVWFRAAVDAGARQPDAVALSTVSASGRPDVRFVLLKGWGPRGFEFFTNYESAKARQLAGNRRAALALFWYETHRQVRAAGVVSRLSRRDSLAYWMTRPQESQAAATVSPQSRVIGSRDELEAAYKQLMDRFQGVPIPLPPFWGGYRLRPEWIEFWQGRPNRLHDRIRYSRTRGRAWRAERLAP
jgi:pyridoxamine 5'-phosphate oxidase